MPDQDVIGATPSDDVLPSTPPLDEVQPFATMMASFDAAAEFIGADKNEFKILRKPDREISVAVPVSLDDGSFTVFDGYRVQHNAGLGPFLGPLRLEGDLKLDVLRALAAWMTWKCAILGVPFGGSAGGIAIDPGQHSTGEVERAVRRYTACLLGDIGPERDIMSPDVGADARTMAWVMDTISSHARHTVNSAVTGKPPELMGTAGHYDSVARGLRVIFQLSRGYLGLPRGPVKIAIQGAGNVGGNLARLLHAQGHLICGISDLSGAFWNKRGLDIPPIMDWRDRTGSLRDCVGDFEILRNDELLAQKCDVLVPCAIRDAIHSRNAHKVEARFVIEGAHGPVSHRADGILKDRGIDVVPDILSNGGSVVLSYFEWVQNRTGFYWTGEMVDRRLNRFMRQAWDSVVVAREQYKDVTLRQAANILAVQRVTAADEWRGIYA